MSVPKTVQRRICDEVSYYTIDKCKNKKCHSDICYRNHLPKWSEYEFLCLPYLQTDWKKYFISTDMFMEFMELMKSRQVITHETVAFVEDDTPKLRIPRGTSKQRTYSAMCCYRWCDSLAPMIYEIITLVKEQKDISLWQIIHYAMSKYVTNSWHNWCNFGVTKSLYTDMGMAHNLSLSLAMPLTFSMSEESFKSTYKDDVTHRIITENANNIAPLTVSKRKFSIPSLLIQRPEDVLSPRWTPLYKIVESSTINHSELQEKLKIVYQEIKDNDPELQKYCLTI